MPPEDTHVYQVELVACDGVADHIKNCQSARRFVLYDAGTRIESQPDHKIRVISATSESSELAL